MPSGRYRSLTSNPSTRRATVFLDRDGVINARLIDDYVTHPNEFRLLPGVVAAICRLKELGFRTVVVTNQRGIAIGRMTRAAVDAIHRNLSEWVAAAGGCLEEFYVCPHDRDEGCLCRKPQAGLLDLAHQREPVAWSESFLVGDSDTDILAGRRKGVCCIKLAGYSKVGADYECSDLMGAVQFISDRIEGQGSR